ncbi:MAG: cytochrome ubiquinol oxidase subunit I [Verrucomicrobia bacterium]|nr:cytochrome ubiquinol oxidase subunit I [Verrucomicrobiota bacterium]
MNVEILARIQFALTVGFHYIYPPLSIGLGLFILFIEGAWIKTKDPKYKEMSKYWVKIFGLTFAIGVASGIVQVFEFGTNWASYSRYVGDVFGSALGAEGIFAFFVESGFLAILLFGWDRVSPAMHFFSALMVALGAHFSAVWIVVANSWMQTPAGYHIVTQNGVPRAEITNFWEMVFNPSSVDRLIHVLIGCWLAGAFLVISISAYYLLKKRHIPFAQMSLKISLPIALVFLVAQAFSGDSSARVVVEHQPAKLAAMEGVFRTQSYAPLYLGGVVDREEQKVKGIAIPGLLSLLSYRDASAEVKGLDAFPKDEWPNSAVVFQTYHLMIMMWSAMLVTAVLAWIFWKKIKLGRCRPLLWLMAFSVAFPQIANQAGWFTAEMGRQPWIVYNLLRTSEGLSKVVSANMVLGSIIMFLVIYMALFSLFIYLLDKKIRQGPEFHEEVGV